MDWFTSAPLWIQVLGGLAIWLALACVCAPILGRFCGLTTRRDNQ